MMRAYGGSVFHENADGEVELTVWVSPFFLNDRVEVLACVHEPGKYLVLGTRNVPDPLFRPAFGRDEDLDRLFIVFVLGFPKKFEPKARNEKDFDVLKIFGKEKTRNVGLEEKDLLLKRFFLPAVCRSEVPERCLRH